MGAVAAQRRTCRTCPAVISEHGETGQCRSCQQRSEAIRAVVAPELRPSRTKPVASPKPRSCDQGGHHGCQHFVMLFRAYEDFLDDCDLCAACGAEGDGAGAVTHAPQCPFWLLKQAQAERKSADRRAVS